MSLSREPHQCSNRLPRLTNEEGRSSTSFISIIAMTPHPNPTMKLQLPTVIVHHSHHREAIFAINKSMTALLRFLLADGEL